MRLLAQFVIELRKSKEEYENKSLDFFLDPRYWPLMLKVVKEMGGWRPTRISGEADPTFTKCSIPLQISYGLTNIMGLAINKAITEKNYAKK